MNASRRIFLAEVREQPAALLTLLEHLDAFVEVGRACAERKPTVVRLVAHGSSDAAAAYGVYAFGLLPGWTALRDSISLSVYYGAEIDFSSSVVVALSQSGQTPDVVSYVERARERGALTVALTNERGSALAEHAELTLPLEAGEERSVAASKTFYNQLAALALLAGAAAGREDEIWDGLRRTAVILADAIPKLEAAVMPVATAFAYVGRMYVIGRGYELATAREIALKLTETCRVAAEPLTSTDLAHGPDRSARLDVPGLDDRLAATRPCRPSWRRRRESAQAGATIVASGSAAGAVEGAAWRLPVPEAPVPLLSPLLSVVPGQLFAAALAEAKGLDPDKPERLTKVTLAQ